MGAGIATAHARSAIPTVMVDVDDARIADGMRRAADVVMSRIKIGRATAADMQALLSQLSASTTHQVFSDRDVVVEAVTENEELKTALYRQLSTVLKKDAILATNTSTISITRMAEAWPDASRFIGMHFFLPVDRMQLVEVIRGKRTSDETVATIVELSKRIKKTPIVVNDSRGFFANRCVLNYVREGQIMLIEGVPAAMIENVARMAGMPVGPLSLNDEVGLDLGWKILQAAKKDLGPAAVDPAQERVLEFMVERNGRFGRKNGKGFYDYPASGKKTLWPGLAELADDKIDPDTLDVPELKQRFLVIQAVEAARTVAEHVITDPREADVGSILGFGFAPFTGGALSYIDGMGVRVFVELCDALTTKHGARFAPPPLLREMAADGETFYRRSKAA